MGPGRPFGSYAYTPDELLKEAKEYFAYCDSIENAIEVDGKKRKIPKSIAGLATWLGVAKSYISNKSKEADYSEMIGYIRQQIEEDVAMGGMLGYYNPTVAVKNLSANFDWKDKIESEITGKDGDPLFPQLTPEQLKNIGGEMMKLG